METTKVPVIACQFKGSMINLLKGNFNPLLTGEIMSRTFKVGKGPLTLLILLLAGGVAGSALGQALATYLPILKNFTTIGLKPSILDLHYLQLSFGLTMSLGPVTALGLLLGFLAYKRL